MEILIWDTNVHVETLLESINFEWNFNVAPLFEDFHDFPYDCSFCWCRLGGLWQNRHILAIIYNPRDHSEIRNLSAQREFGVWTLAGAHKYLNCCCDGIFCRLMSGMRCFVNIAVLHSTMPCLPPLIVSLTCLGASSCWRTVHRIFLIRYTILWVLLRKI